jgi:hypothetical protein
MNEELIEREALRTRMQRVKRMWWLPSNMTTSTIAAQRPTSVTPKKEISNSQIRPFNQPQQTIFTLYNTVEQCDGERFATTFSNSSLPFSIAGSRQIREKISTRWDQLKNWYRILRACIVFAVQQRNDGTTTAHNEDIDKTNHTLDEALKTIFRMYCFRIFFFTFFNTGLGDRRSELQFIGTSMCANEFQFIKKVQRLIGLCTKSFMFLIVLDECIYVIDNKALSADLRAAMQDLFVLQPRINSTILSDTKIQSLLHAQCVTLTSHMYDMGRLESVNMCEHIKQVCL